MVPQLGLFKSALGGMTQAVVRQPQGWTDYLESAGIQVRPDPAPIISVQDLQHLRPDLRQAQTMLFRLGVTGRQVRFGMARTDDWPDEFFLPDDATPGPPDVYLSPARLRDLYGYGLFPAVERTLVNLACASGALSELLQLDSPDPLPPPAMGASAYTFQFRPLAAAADVYDHVNGQVDLDCIVVAKRERREHVFMVEAKFERLEKAVASDRRRLAKHKLLYPVLAIRPRVSPGMPIVPVSLRAAVGPGFVDYHVIECEPFLGGDGMVLAVADVKPAKPARALRLPVRLDQPLA